MTRTDKNIKEKEELYPHINSHIWIVFSSGESFEGFHNFFFHWKMSLHSDERKRNLSVCDDDDEKKRGQWTGKIEIKVWNILSKSAFSGWISLL